MVTPAESKTISNDFAKKMQSAYESLKKKDSVLTTVELPKELASMMNRVKISSEEVRKPADTSVKLDQISDVIKALTQVPDGFNAHNKAKKVMDNRSKVLDGKGAVDWPTAEFCLWNISG